MKTYTIRQILLLIVFSLVIPACLIALGFSVKGYIDGRDSATSSTLLTARAMTLVVERELGALQSATQTLTYSLALPTRDFAGFYQQAKNVLLNTAGFTFVLSDKSGQQLVNTLKPYGSDLPHHGNPALLSKVIASGKPVIGDLFFAPLVNKPVFSICVPVVIDGQVLYGLDIGIWPDLFSKILDAQNIPNDWVVAIFDSSGTIVARSKAPEQFIGKKGATALLQAMAIKPEGILEIETLEGIPVYLMYSRSLATGWSVGIGIPKSTVTAGLWRSIWLMTGGTIGLLLVGLWAASLAGSRITRSFHALIPQALALGRGEPVASLDIAIREAISVGSAIATASELLQVSEANRQKAEEALRNANVQLERRVEERTAELNEAVQKLEVACHAADTANAAKSSFVANMSHEIRTPMNAVLGLLQLVQKTSLDVRQQDYVTKAQSAAKSLLGILNDILDFSKIDAGKLQLEVHPFGLEELMRDLAVVLSGAQTDSEVEVIFDIDPALPQTLLGDRLRLQQVLINLGGNAVKFTKAGQVLIRIAQVERLAGETKLRVEVSDSGIGMSAEQLARIFDGFTQAEASTTRRFGGTGLGLVISQRLVSLMGGSLLVESALGRGSRFWFDIKLPVENATEAGSGYPSLPASLRVLVVDDNALSREILIKTLEGVGWTADSANDGTTGVESVRRAQTLATPYDVVLMDWRMPGVDGLTAASQIRQVAPVSRPPVIIMVPAFGREVLDEAVQLKDAPFVDFLTKPVTPEQLLTAIQQAVADPVAQAALQPDRPSVTKRLTGLRILLVEDNALNRLVATHLLHAEGAVVDVAEGGVQGVSMATQPGDSYDAIVMDVQMPDMDGLEATRHIRANPHGQRIPILAMTANASPADRADCLTAGMDDHIAKPIDIDELVERLLTLIGRTGVGEPVATLGVKSVSDGVI